MQNCLIWSQYEVGICMFQFEVEMYSWPLSCLSFVGAKGQLSVHPQLTDEDTNALSPPLLHTHTPRNPKQCGWQSKEELPSLSDCTTEPECCPARKSRHLIYRWINWQCRERLTGHSSWWPLAQWHERTGLLRFDFLSKPPWQMSYGEGGGVAASHHHKASPLCPPL